MKTDFELAVEDAVLFETPQSVIGKVIMEKTITGVDYDNATLSSRIIFDDGTTVMIHAKKIDNPSNFI